MKPYWLIDEWPKNLFILLLFTDIQSPNIILLIQQQLTKLIKIILLLNTGKILKKNINNTVGLITADINKITGAEDPL